jgi:ribosomal protein L20
MRGSKYSVFMGQAHEKKVELDRKMLSNIAVVFPEVFDAIVESVAK